MSNDIPTSDRITSFNQTPILSSPGLDQNETEFSELNFDLPAFEKKQSFGVQNEPNNIYTFDLRQPMSNISSKEVDDKVRLKRFNAK